MKKFFKLFDGKEKVFMIMDAIVAILFFMNERTALAVVVLSLILRVWFLEFLRKNLINEYKGLIVLAYDHASLAYQELIYPTMDKKEYPRMVEEFENFKKECI